MRCTYCAFNIYAHADALIPAYVAALCNELRWLGQATKHPVNTLYFGGGTPSLLTPAQVDTILQTCRRHFALAPQAEISFEANPGSLDLDYLEQLRATGVNRLSIGMQSAQPADLNLMSRDHTVEAVPRAVEATRRAGFHNLNLDLIFGLPYQTLDTWLATVGAALALAPEHLSMYALELEEKTAMTRNITRGRLPIPDDDLAATMYEAADALAGASGLVQYEISNWARPGFECAHNLQYWRHEPYLGIGAGAHGFTGQIRYEIVRQIRRYIERASSQKEVSQFPLTDSVAYVESIDRSTAMLEHMLTGLRLVQKGVGLDSFRQQFGVSLDEVYGSALKRLTRDGLLRREDGHVLLTPSARLISNRVFLEFIP